VEATFELGPYLSGVHFPATKQQLVARAYSNGAADSVLAAFHALPEREYVSANEVGAAISAAL
jgi:hypothetical protein